MQATSIYTVQYSNITNGCQDMAVSRKFVGARVECKNDNGFVPVQSRMLVRNTTAVTHTQCDTKTHKILEVCISTDKRTDVRV